MVKPRPVPSAPLLCCGVRRVNSLNISFCSSSVIPGPESLIAIINWSSFISGTKADKEIFPSRVYFMAFDRIFTTICRTFMESPRYSPFRVLLILLFNFRPFCAARGRKLSVISCNRRSGLYGTVLTSILFDSSLEKSSILLARCRICSADPFMFLRK